MSRKKKCERTTNDCKNFLPFCRLSLHSYSVVRLDNWIGRKLQKQGYQLISDSREDGGKDALATIYGRRGEEVVLAVSKRGNRQFAVMHWRR